MLHEAVGAAQWGEAVDRAVGSLHSRGAQSAAERRYRRGSGGSRAFEVVGDGAGKTDEPSGGCEADVRCGGGANRDDRIWCHPGSVSR